MRTAQLSQPKFVCVSIFTMVTSFARTPGLLSPLTIIH